MDGGSHLGVLVTASTPASYLGNQVPFSRAAVGTAVSLKVRMKKNAVCPGLIIALSFLTGTRSGWKSTFQVQERKAGLCVTDLK